MVVLLGGALTVAAGLGAQTSLAGESARARDSGEPKLEMPEESDSSLHFTGGGAVQARFLAEGRLKALIGEGLEPLSLAAGDLDEDGVPDLIVGYHADGEGALAIYRGNIFATYPNGPGAADLRAKGLDTDQPFVSPARLVAGPALPDFLAIGDFDADGHLDVIVASAGDRALYLLPGDGKGRLQPAVRMDLDGPISAFTTGEIHRRDGLGDIVVATRTTDGPKLLVFASPRGAWNATPQAVDLPAPATQLELGQLDNHFAVDLAIVAGGDVLLLHGQDRRAMVQTIALEVVDLPFAAASVAIGDFSWANGPRDEMAVLAEDGGLWMLERGEPKKTSAASRAPSAVRDVPSWRIVDRIAQTRFVRGADGSGRPLMSLQVGSGPGEELVVLDSAGRQLEVLATSGRVRPRAVADSSSVPSAQYLGILAPEKTASAPAPGDPELFGPPPRPAVIRVPGAPVAILPMRLSPDALDDLVVLVGGYSQPMVLKTTVLASVVVDSTTDVLDGTTTSIAELIANPGGDGVISLREAITAANNTPGMDTIDFNIPVATDPGCDAVSGVCTIQPGASGLPTITEAVMIDGTSQPTFAGTPVIELDGSLTGANVTGLAGNAGSSTVRGLVFNRFANNSDVVFWYLGGNIIEGNFFGTDPTGTVARGGLNAVHLYAIPGNTVGGTTAPARNLFSGGSMGVALNAGTSTSVVIGNLFGTDVSGSSALGNTGNSVLITGSSMNNTIGGTVAGATNVMSGALSGATSLAIGSGCSGNLVQNNLLGTDISGTINLGNDGTAVLVYEANGNTIGGSTVAANTIAYSQTGVDLVGDTATGNLIVGNTIFGNTALGIDLCSVFSVVSLPNATLIQCDDPTAVSPNDAGDLDTGANNVQNFPVLTSIVHGAGITTIGGTFNSTPSSTFTLDFYSNSSCNPSVHGEGEIRLGSEVVSTDATGNSTISAVLAADVPPDHFVTATATDAGNNTSEFSRCLVEGPDLEIGISAAPDPVQAGGSLVYTITVENFGTGDSTGVTVTDTLPGEAAFVSSNPPCSVASGVATCALGDLVSGASTQLAIEVTVDNTAVGSVTNAADVAANETELVTVNNSTQETTAIVLFDDGFESGDTSAWSATMF
ncbi:MAG: hypothetical protein ACC742_04225 [Thermoanaerobaculales bacterium]